MKNMEEELLSLGYWPNCEWVREMPLQFYDVQCNKAEISYLVNILRPPPQASEPW